MTRVQTRRVRRFNKVFSALPDDPELTQRGHCPTLSRPAALGASAGAEDDLLRLVDG